MSTFCHLVFQLEYTKWLSIYSKEILTPCHHIQHADQLQPIVQCPQYLGADHKILRESRMKMRDAALSYANKKEGRREIEEERVCCFTLPFRDTHLVFTRCPGGISMPGFCLHCLCVCQHLGFLLCLLSFFFHFQTNLHSFSCFFSFNFCNLWTHNLRAIQLQYFFHK